MSKKVLITDKVHPLIIEGLEKLNYTIDYDTTIDMKVLPQIINQYHGMIINSKILMHKEMIDLAINLKFIGRLGSGMEIIDKDYALSKGIIPINSPEGNRNAVAEHAVGMMLAFANNLYKSNKEVKQFDWRREENRGFELEGKSIGIIGLGHTGEKLARKLEKWNMNIMTYDKYRQDYPNDLDFVNHVDVSTIQKEAEIISFHLPLTMETKHLCNRHFLENLKKRPLIVNTSRGNVINTQDLITGLQENIIRGACLDVFENEKVETYTQSEKDLYTQLFDFENVIVSPHIAGWTVESLAGIAQVLMDKITAIHK